MPIRRERSGRNGEHNSRDIVLCLLSSIVGNFLGLFVGVLIVFRVVPDPFVLLHEVFANGDLTLIFAATVFVAMLVAFWLNRRSASWFTAGVFAFLSSAFVWSVVFVKFVPI